jgi:hypothetical protein
MHVLASCLHLIYIILLQELMTIWLVQGCSDVMSQVSKRHLLNSINWVRT